jgi:hypothetical protein
VIKLVKYTTGVPVRHAPAFFLLALLLPQRQCSVVSPDGIKGKVEEALRPYFPNARGQVAPQQQAIIGLTCTQGVGPGFVAQMQKYIATDREINQQLSLVQFAPLLGGAHYRYFLLGFDGGWVRYDLDAHRVDAISMTPEVLQEYRQTCGFSSQ